MARLILDAEIIPRRAGFLAPPRAFDAFRSFGGSDLMERAPPAEAHRRAVRDGGDRFDRLGLGEQAQRPRGKLGAVAEAPEGGPAGIARGARLSGKGAGSQLRNMAVVGDEPRDAA